MSFLTPSSFRSTFVNAQRGGMEQPFVLQSTLLFTVMNNCVFITECSNRKQKLLSFLKLYQYC